MQDIWVRAGQADCCRACWSRKRQLPDPAFNKVSTGELCLNTALDTVCLPAITYSCWPGWCCFPGVPAIDHTRGKADTVDHELYATQISRDGSLTYKLPLKLATVLECSAQRSLHVTCFEGLEQGRFCCPL